MEPTETVQLRANFEGLGELKYLPPARLWQPNNNNDNNQTTTMTTVGLPHPSPSGSQGRRDAEGRPPGAQALSLCVKTNERTQCTMRGCRRLPFQLG
mmetsp:Transcript_96697/g.174640  ORF Transcript_96697/g.174640 Transcript_96697/m.174640 type:complete len:97 (+) Transcript_96697:52-342(+)